MGRPKGSKNKPQVLGAEPSVSSEVAAGVVIADEQDRKLDHFQYHASEHDAEVWEHGDVSPMHVPQAIKEKYPNLRFHWCSSAKWDRRGKNYDGWQTFSDPQLCPDGLRRGNDLFLAVMPEERARKRERFVSNKSTEMIKGIQERNLDQIDRIRHGESTGVAPLDTEVRGVEIGARPETNVSYGGKPRKGGGYNRGYSAEQLQEIIIKNQEKLARGRKYFT